eukprot:150209-Prorocentrum_minimum.AAC.1
MAARFARRHPTRVHSTRIRIHSPCAGDPVPGWIRAAPAGRRDGCEQMLLVGGGACGGLPLPEAPRPPQPRPAKVPPAPPTNRTIRALLTRLLFMRDLSSQPDRAADSPDRAANSPVTIEAWARWTTSGRRTLAEKNYKNYKKVR